jgi:hypothetical protein
VFHDIDGSAGGVPDSYVVIDNGIANDDNACQMKPDWNAAVCKGDFGRMQIGAGGGARGGGAQRRRRRSWCCCRPTRSRAWCRGRSRWFRCCSCFCRCSCSGRWCRSRRSWRERRCCSTDRSQPQQQEVYRWEYHGTRRYRDQGGHRTVSREHQRERIGQRLMGGFRAAGIRHRKCRYATKQPGCTAQRHRHLVLQRRWLVVGQACLSRRYRPRRSWHCPWKRDPSQQVS